MNNKKLYVVTCPEYGWDCVIGLFLAESEDDIIQMFCEEQYGDSYSKEEYDKIYDKYIFTPTKVQEVFTKAEIRNQIIDNILK